MATQSVKTPEALDALIVASLQARRDTWLRGARRQKMRTLFAYGCSGCIVLFALAAFFLARDPDAGATLVTIALVTLTFSYFAGIASQKKLADSLRQMDQSTK